MSVRFLYRKEMPHKLLPGKQLSNLRGSGRCKPHLVLLDIH